MQRPNTVQVFEGGEHGGLPFFSRECVEGGSLAKKLAHTPQPPRAAAALAGRWPGPSTSPTRPASPTATST
ncbi:MAG TPA: hypothetical protein VFA26_06010 [Gemmataceae bacterium]|nr:hypothetical protein [Gemmataceae bacterium]